jgi:RimJ/RimL family protein N-acetyltransferase
MSRFQAITTERLVLRRLTADDAPVMAAYRSDPAIARYQDWTETDPVALAAFFAELEAIDPGRPPGQWFQFGVAERATGRLVGDCGLCVRSDSPDTADLGYTLAGGYHGLGYATEAAAALCQWAFSELELARIVATTDARNLPSIRVLERLGMTRIARVETSFRDAPCVELGYELRRPPIAGRG